MKAVIAIVSIILVSALALGLACARPASSPAPAPAPAPAPKPSPTTAVPNPPTTAAAKDNPLAQIIEGAKKEGTVTAYLSSAHTPTKMVDILQKNIMNKYSVDLKITSVATPSQGPALANAIMEYKTGTAPTWDLVIWGSDYIVDGMKTGIFEKVAWESILEAGTSPDVLPQHPDLKGGIIAWSGMTGIMYNPRKASSTEVPKSLSGLADPKWKGRLGILNYGAYWAKWAYLLGKDNTLSNLRSILKNKPLLGTMDDLNNRYLLGEIDVALISATYLTSNKQKNMPSEWQILNFIESRDFEIAVLKGAKHPNAAKLITIYFASSDGMKYNVEQGGKGIRSLQGNEVGDAVMQAKKLGIPIYTLDHPGLLEFLLSSDYEKWEKEFQLVMQGQ